MKKRILSAAFIFVLMAVGFTSSLLAQQVKWQPPFFVPEFINYNQGWSGLTQPNPYGGFMISYNPRTLEVMQAPWYMYLWVRVHEYGHVNRIPLRDFTESGADCWAAGQLGSSDPEVMRQVIDYVDNVIGNRAADANHGTGHQQAILMRQCSGL